MTDSVLHQTIQNLEGVLPQLEEQERALRNQLDAVAHRVTSTRNALEGLRVLTGDAHTDRQPAAVAAATGELPSAAASEESGKGQAVASVEADPTPEAAPEAAVEADGAASVPQPRAATSTRTKRRTAKKTAGKKTAAARPKAKKAATKRAAADPQAATKDAGNSLLDSALEILKNAGTPMRPRDINAALGREATPGQIESVRNTLDRAVKKTELVTRPGRGTYAAA
ncbi:hypothetical protein ACFVFQ_10795 [Streptomyces sp. NPDC057743]|uniref:hypothetical protein n=1 Tax=Streptomyces sp. NPDC057743 TaxID=3346236 RepID=UPI0036CD53E4